MATDLKYAHKHVGCLNLWRWMFCWNCNTVCQELKELQLFISAFSQN